jgi:hypothetical protein
MRWFIVGSGVLFMAACGDVTGPEPTPAPLAQQDVLTLAPEDVGGGVLTANGWYEEEEIYYILGGIEDATQRGENDLYLIGGDRAYQANVAEFIPGEAGYTPHWNVNVVHTAPGRTLGDILASPYVSTHYPEALFDDVEDILDAWAAGLVTVEHPGVVVLCPVIPEAQAEAPGNTPLSEDFPAFPDTF